LPVRVYELAREFDISTKEILEACQEAGLTVKSHSSTIEEYEADLVRRRLKGLSIDDDEDEVPAAPVAPAKPVAPPPPAVDPDEQLAKARSLHVALPTRMRLKPKAAGARSGAGPEGTDAPPAVDAAPAPVAEAAPVEEAAPVAAAPAPVIESTPEAAPPAETLVAPAAPAAPVEAAPEAPVAEAAPPAEPVAAAPEAAPPATPAAAEEARRVSRQVRRPPGPKLAPRPKAGPKLAQRPRPHPQAIKTPEAPPAPHPQAVGVGVTKKKETTPARPARGRPKPAPASGPSQPPVPPTAEEIAAAAAKGRRKGVKGAAEEEAEGKRKAHAFRRRERIRKRDDMDDTLPGGAGSASSIASERVRVSKTGRTMLTRGQRGPSARAAAAEGPKKAVVEMPITVKNLSSALGIKGSEIIMKLMGKGVMATINDSLTEEQALEIALERGLELEVVRERGPADAVKEIETRIDPPESLVLRPPVVVFMGHVDHGKTSLMDYIRKSKVAAGEAGGITQHIGAYRVPVGDRWITFLDTPGHAAFTAMRSRGAKVTDVAVLVVAADDGVMPQTEEAINHVKAAEVPIVVALNKSDLPQANPQRVKQQLIQFGLQPEEWGGKTIIIETSATTGKNVDKLLEALLLEAEMRELRANPNRSALGTVIEAAITEGFGPVATLLVQNGTLKAGDVVVAGTAYGRVRALSDDTGKPMKSAGPSVPVRVAGLSTVPEAGDRFYVMEELSEAKHLAEDRQLYLRQTALVESRKPRTLEAVFEQMTTQAIRELPIVIKGDVQGSVEALRGNLEKIAHPEVRVHVIHAAVGGVNESDVLLADASNAIIIGFNVAPDPTARVLAEARGVDIRLYQIIYAATDDVRKALEGLLSPQQSEKRLGECSVSQTFKISRVGTVAGCMVTDGVIARSARVRVIRDGVVVHTGGLQSLKRVKDDVREVRAGQDCGLHIQGFDDIKVGDRVESFETVSTARTL
jgi:translation initiation factor IF-2